MNDESGIVQNLSGEHGRNIVAFPCHGTYIVVDGDEVVQRLQAPTADVAERMVTTKGDLYVKVGPK